MRRARLVGLYKVAGGQGRERGTSHDARGGGPGDTETKLKKLKETPRRVCGLVRKEPCTGNTARRAIWARRRTCWDQGRPQIAVLGTIPGGRKLGDLGNPGAFSLTKFCEAIGPGSSTGCVQAPPDRMQLSRGCPWYLTSWHGFIKLPGTLDTAKYCSRRDGKLQAQFPRSSAGCGNISPRQPKQ